MALQWEYFLSDARSGNVGGTFEYFDTEAQIVIIRDTDDALTSTYDSVDFGKWEDSVWENNLRIGNFGLSQFVPRHGYNGEVWAVGITPTLVPADTGRFATPEVPAGFYLYRYKYFEDLTNYMIKYDTSEQSENPIKDASLTIQNLGEGDINKTSTLFSLGTRMICKLGMGDSARVFVSTVFLDDIPWNVDEDSLTITGRNALGYFLADQTFDEVTSFSGTRVSVIKDILSGTDIDLKKVIIDPSGIEASNPTFESTDSILSGLTYVLDVWGWKIKELPNGLIIIGTPSFMELYAPVTIHSFKNNEAFTRGISQSSDGAYSRLALKSNISQVIVDNVVVAEAFTRTLYKNLRYLDNWKLGSRRTLYINVLNDMSEEAMEALATEYILAYQYIGINMTRTLPIHPEIATGDPFVISDLEDGQFMGTGIITKVTNAIDVKSGSAKTTISVNSGGTVIPGPPVQTFTAANVTGDTRKRELLDVIKKEAIAAAKAKKDKALSSGTQSKSVDGGDD